MEFIRTCAKHGNLTEEQCYIRHRGGKVARECRQCIREAALTRVPKPCAIHGSDPPDGWTKVGECATCRNAYLQKYRKDRPEQCAGYESARDPEKRKAQHRKSHHKRRDEILPKNRERLLKRRIRVLAHYSNGSMKCACGESRLYALAIDHIDDKNRKGPDGGSKLCQWLEKNGFPNGFQVLCHNCNSLKSWPTRSSRPDLVRRYEQELLLKKEVLARYSNGECKCAMCGRDDVRILNIDHIDFGGTKHRKSLKIAGGVQFYRWLKREGFPEGYRVLCFSCNLADYLEKLHTRT